LLQNVTALDSALIFDPLVALSLRAAALLKVAKPISETANGVRKLSAGFEGDHTVEASLNDISALQLFIEYPCN